MKIKKIVLSLLTIITFGIFVLTQNIASYAETTNTPLYLGITELRTYDTPNMGYAIGDPNTNGTTGDAAKIWNIVEYSSASSNNPIEANIYCVKAGVGFTSVKTRDTYNVFYNMKTEREQIKAQNDVLKSIVEGTIDVGDGKTVSKYDALLALADILYLHGESTASDKAQLLETAKCNYVDGYDIYPLTDDDIDAVQQAAIWYFTNYNEENGKYDKYNNTSWLNYTLDGNTYTSLEDYKRHDTDEGIIRSNQAITLYKYLIDTAKANANNYSEENVSTTGVPAKVNTTKLEYTESGSNYIIGPINITATTNNAIPYDIDFTVSNGQTATTNYKLLDKDKNEVASGKTVKDLVGQDFYISMAKDNVTTVSTNIKIKYKTTKSTLWASTTNNETQPVMIPKKENIEIPTDLTVTPNQKVFDLSLRKYITKVNGVELSNGSSRVPSIDESTLASGTTATYKHKKDPVIVEEGNKVTYKITIYNEGEKDGRATKVVDQLPTGLKFSKVVSGNFELDSYDETTNKLNLKRLSTNTDNLSAYTTGKLDSETIEIECEVTASADSTNKKVLTNVAWISEEFDSESNVTITNQTGADRDSEPSTVPNVNKDNMSDYTGSNNKTDLTDSTYYYKGQQDDDDFEKLVLLPQSFDLKLIKRIVSVNGTDVPERIESVDVSNLNTATSSKTTAEYNLNKDPVSVKKGDFVKYTFRVYNEGDIDGYASEITEDIPEGLEFIWSEKEGTELSGDTTLTADEKEAIQFNQEMLWANFQYNTDKSKITMISTDYLSKENETTPGSNLIKAFGSNDGTKTEDDLLYKEVSVMLKVVAEDISGSVIRNEAEISKDSDKDGNPVDDRDSDPEKWVKYEDDEDYDNIKLQAFDLALRKFIVAVSHDETIDDADYLKNADGSYQRAPVVNTSKLNTKDENGKLITTATYNHTKTPVEVTLNDTVVYNLRVYNEGDTDGYASEIKDHLPAYLKFVDGDFNKKYGWTVSEDGRTVTTSYLADQKITKTTTNEDGTTVLSYKEVPIMCKVTKDVKSNYKVTNIADITEYRDENNNILNSDRDSIPNNVVLPSDENLPEYKDNETGEYIPGQQDDDDFEKVVVKIFDLALRKWVTQAIVIENGVETVTNTGHDPWDDPEEIVKVELNRKKLSSIVVKFKYSIRVYNQGDIAGYAKEIKDTIPLGLKMIESENPQWKDEGDSVVSTRALENTLLQPGEYADVEILLTWINGSDNIGLKTNIAEISEDYNDKGVPDIDSIPDNGKQGEDDIDIAEVILSISTGSEELYIGLGLGILVTMGIGLVLIRKFVL